MNISVQRGVKIAAIFGLAATFAVGFGAPVSAAAGQNEGTGITVTGPIVTAGPFAMSSFNSGPFTNTLASVSVVGLLTSGTLVTNADSTTADASVENLSVTLGTLSTLTADAVSSQCSYDASTQLFSGSSSIANGVITITGGTPIFLATAPAANTMIAVTTPITGTPIATVTLNRQVTNGDGSFTVDAIYIELVDLTVIRVATSTCQPDVLVVPTVAPVMAIGAGVLALLGGAFILFRRRQHAVALA